MGENKLLVTDTLPLYTSLSAISDQQIQGNSGSEFKYFPRLPPEIRIQIWLLALTPRIVKWTRIKYKNVFTTSSESFPIFYVNQESRSTALLYGKYQELITSGPRAYFRPQTDYLFFDAKWKNLDGITGSVTIIPSVDYLDFIPTALKDVTRIMIHPNFSDERRFPVAKLENFTKLEQILIGVDEKQLNIKNKFPLSSVYDVKMYYAAHIRKLNPEVKIPRVAIGALGWTGDERQKMTHGNEDGRLLVGVFETPAEVERHAAAMAMEEREWIQKMGGRRTKKPLLNFRPVAAANQVDAGDGS